MTLELCQLIDLNKEHFQKKIIRKCARKASPEPFLILVNNPKQPLHAKKYFKIKKF